MAAVIFDLDETLLDTSTLRDDRRPRRGGQLALRLDEAEPYVHRGASVQAAELPARAHELGFVVGILTDSPRWYAESLLGAFGIYYDALLDGIRWLRAQARSECAASPRGHAWSGDRALRGGRRRRAPTSAPRGAQAHSASVSRGRGARRGRGEDSGPT